jgi:C4-dicarboxylate-specific signal transduction histidine kinase
MIRDTGCGISEEIKPDLFKPFCTSKGGKHPGLGLFISRELLTPYGASFSYSSGAGETTFSVGFPMSLGRGNR